MLHLAIVATLLSCVGEDPVDSGSAGDGGATTADGGSGDGGSVFDGGTQQDGGNTDGGTADGGTADGGGSDGGTSDGGTTDGGTSDGGTTGSPMPDFALVDLNPSSPRFGETVSPRDYLEQVSGWYFIHAT